MSRRATLMTLVVLVALVLLGYWALAQLFAVHGLSTGGSDEGAHAVAGLLLV